MDFHSGSAIPASSRYVNICIIAAEVLGMIKFLIANPDLNCLNFWIEFSSFIKVWTTVYWGTKNESNYILDKKGYLLYALNKRENLWRIENWKNESINWE
jgi:hypothetical protein